MEKSLSQKVARFLEIICYFLIIPTSLIEIATIYYGSIFLFTTAFGALLFCLLITAIYTVGTLLLYGYYKHSRGKLSKQKSFWLWIATLVFNFIPFAYMTLFWSSNSSLTNSTESYWFYNIFAFYTAIILLAIVALISDFRSERAAH
jgi:hypothetical protein